VAKNCTKQVFSGPSAFLQYFNSWKKVKTVNKSLIDKITKNKNYIIYPPNKNSHPSTNKTPITLCGNGTVDKQEECDGGEFCDKQCNLIPLFTAKNWTDNDNPEQITEHRLIVGDKLAISTGITVRIENITPDLVEFSIWGKDQSNTCRLISNTGVLYLPKKDLLPFREFTSAFIELAKINGSTATIKKYIDAEARKRCEQIGDWKKPIACSFYSDGKSYFVEDGKFKIFFHKLEHQMAAEYVGRALNNCLSSMQKQLPALQNISSFTPLWGIYAGAYPDVPMTSSADYERISLKYDFFSTQYISEFLPYIKNGRCPIELAYLPHELSHLLFAESALQGSYDWLRGAISEDTPGTRPEALDEGMAEFFAYWGTQNTDNAKFVQMENKCLGDRLIDSEDGSTNEQRIYKNILQGRGYGSNRYNAGFCFFNRIRNNCGDNTIRNIFEKAILDSGSITAHPTLFNYMSQTCDQTKVMNIINDFGFDQSYLNATQKYPIDGFASGITENGCL
jgi:hypothetical protein